MFSLLAALLLLWPLVTVAVPYACGLSNRNGTVSFRLNEAADNVKVVSAEGAVTNDLGALPAGLGTFSLGVTGTFQVLVFKAGPAGFLTPVQPNRGAVLQISSDTSATRFFSPRGVAVNTHPASPHFGRIYAANATGGPAGNGLSGSPRTVGDGLYALNSDFTDALGQGDSPLTGGLDFASGLDLSPYRLTIGQDDSLYVCDLSEVSGGLYVVDPDISAGSGTNVLGGPPGGSFPVGNSRVHGRIAAAVMEGSLAESNLVAYVIDQDLQTDRVEPARTMLNSLWIHYLLGEIPGPPYDVPDLVIAAPWVGFASQIMDLARGTNGFFYVNTFRTPGNDWAGLYVHDASGAPLWNSLEATRAHLNDPAAADLLRATGGGDVSPQGDFAAVINLESGDITVLPLVGGLPDLAHRLTFEAFPGITGGQGRDVAFDAAGNLYAISSGAQVLRAFSPGGRTTAITSSDGAFRVLRPPAVKVVAATPVINEGGSAGVFTICRTGDTNNDLVVVYSWSGSATADSDYLIEANATESATIPAGATNVEIVITTVNDAISEPVETVTLTLLGSAQYDLGIPSAATMAIADDDPAIVTITAVDARAYERLPADTITFVIERIGETNSELSIDYGIQAGTADPERDYTGVQGGGLPARIYLAPGQMSGSLVLAPLDDLELEGDETVVVTLFSGSSPYLVGTPNRAVGVIVDDEMPPGAVLFSDDLDTDTSASSAINNVGQVVGYFLPSNGPASAFLWSAGQGMQDLGTLDGVSTAALAINDAGQVVGSTWIAEQQPRAFLWLPSEGMRDLGSLGGVGTEAYDINDVGQVVGYSTAADDAARHAFVWTARDGMEDLYSLTGMTDARAINNRGQVVGGDRVATLRFATPNGAVDAAKGSGFYTAAGPVKSKAHFTFSVNSASGQSAAPNGAARFWIPGTRVTFESAAIEMLLVSGSNRAQFWGSGTLNGASARFRITAVDGRQPGGGNPKADAIRIELWDARGTLVYDTQPGATPDAALTTAIDGGSIQIGHR